MINEVYEPHELQSLIESSRRILRHVPAVGGDFQKLGFAYEVGFLLSQFEGFVRITVNKPDHCLHDDDTCSPEILFLLVLEGVALCFSNLLLAAGDVAFESLFHKVLVIRYDLS